MPRKGRPVPSGQYGNRSDLRTTQAVAAPKGMPYGERGKLEAAQKSIPLPAGGPSGGASDMAAALAAAQQHEFEPVNLGGESERPDEVVTAGLRSGPGVGPEALGLDPNDDPTVAELRALYKAFPNADLAELIDDLNNGVTF